MLRQHSDTSIPYWLLFSSLYLIPPLSPSPSAANSAANLFCQEVWSQCEPGNSEPAGQLPVWAISIWNTEPKLILGECVRRARWRFQPIGHAAHILPLLLEAGPGQSCCLAAGKPKRSQLQVSLVNAFTYTNTYWRYLSTLDQHIHTVFTILATLHTCSDVQVGSSACVYSPPHLCKQWWCKLVNCQKLPCIVLKASYSHDKIKWVNEKLYY